MMFLPIVAAIGASLGWASGIVLAEAPAKQLGAFLFTRIQLMACALIVTLLVSLLGFWKSVDWAFWPAFVTSSIFGIVLGNLAMIACLRRGGPRRTELLLSMKPLVVGLMAFIWLNETPTPTDLLGAGIALGGVCLAVFFGTNAASKSDTQSGKLSIIILLGLSATALQGFGFLSLKPALQAGLEPLAATAIRLVGASILISILALGPKTVVRGTNSGLPNTDRGAPSCPDLSDTWCLHRFCSMPSPVWTPVLPQSLGPSLPCSFLPILWLKDRQRPHGCAILGALLSVLGTGIIALA